MTTNKNDSHQRKWILLGASRGLGDAFFKLLQARSFGVDRYSRKIGGFDAANSTEWESWLQKWHEEMPTHIVYFAGGGPFGEFGKKEWKDHTWAWRVNFEFPARLLHSICSRHRFPLVKQVCFVGSAIAESKPDKNAASYAAAKHALCGLVESVHLELLDTQSTLPLDLRLFSPGYMDTEMLPRNAWPRHLDRLKSRQEVAGELFQWLEDSTCANQHQVFE